MIPGPDVVLTPARMLRLLLLVVLGVGGYAAFQLGPGWLRFLSGRETAALRKQAAKLFVDGLLIAYPLALLASAAGAVALCYLGCAIDLAGGQTARVQRLEARCGRGCFCFAVRRCSGSQRSRPGRPCGGRG